jgi:hypothetical protein
MMERRKTPRKDWVIGKDDTGRSVLEWKVEYRRVKGPESDPCARTHDFLNRLAVPDLTLADDHSAVRMKHGLNPYDTGKHHRQKFES